MLWVYRVSIKSTPPLHFEKINKWAFGNLYDQKKISDTFSPLAQKSVFGGFEGRGGGVQLNNPLTKVTFNTQVLK